MKITIRSLLLAAICFSFAGCPCENYPPGTFIVNFDTDGNGRIDRQACYTGEDIMSAEFVAGYEAVTNSLGFTLYYRERNPSNPSARSTAIENPAKFSPSVARAAAAIEPFAVLNYYFETQISLPIKIARPNKKGDLVLTKIELTNKEIINLAKGRSLTAPNLKSERLLSVVPVVTADWPHTSIVVFDTADPLNEVKILSSADGALLFGVKDGIVAFGIGDLPAMSTPELSFPDPIRLSFTTIGTARSEKNTDIPRFQSKSLAVTGSVSLVIDGQPTTGVILNGKVRTYGKIFALLTGPVP